MTIIAGMKLSCFQSVSDIEAHLVSQTVTSENLNFIFNQFATS